jgi:hypothetical protein
MQLLSTLGFLLIAQSDARNVGDPTGLSLRGAKSVNIAQLKGSKVKTNVEASPLLAQMSLAGMTVMDRLIPVNGTRVS